MIDFLKGTVGKDYFSDRLYGCQECIAEYLASKEPLSTSKNITVQIGFHGLGGSHVLAGVSSTS